MQKCAYCGSTIIMGGVRSGPERFCNNKCAANGHVLRLAAAAPAQLVDRQLNELFHSNCPKCHGNGPLDVYKAHRVWSALVLTRWTTSSQVCCRSCASKSQLGAIAFCLLLGWWGFPWGLILTPTQIIRNIVGMFGRDSSAPSEDLRRLVLVNLGAQALQQQKPAQALPAKTAPQSLLST